MSLNTHHSLRHTSQSRSFPASGGSTLPVKDEPCVLKLRLGRRKALTRYSVPESVALRISRPAFQSSRIEIAAPISGCRACAASTRDWP